MVQGRFLKFGCNEEVDKEEEEERKESTSTKPAVNCFYCKIVDF